MLSLAGCLRELLVNYTFFVIVAVIIAFAVDCSTKTTL